MGQWTVVDGALSDGLRMRLYLAVRDGKLWSATVEDDLHPKTEDEFLWRLGKSEKWERARSGSGSELLGQAATQVAEYFAGRRVSFDLPIGLQGTPFQLRVWEQLMQIPFGASRSYGDVAEAVGQPTAYRAVGNANGRNRLPVVVPCHRVLAAGGKLGGFTGGIGLKRRLLDHEAAVLGKRHAA